MGSLPPEYEQLAQLPAGAGSQPTNNVMAEGSSHTKPAIEEPVFPDTAGEPSYDSNNKNKDQFPSK